MPLILQGATSGQATLQATDAQTVTITMPATSGTLVTTGGAQTIEFADGSASAPSITNSGDTNTGMFFPAADTIAFTEGGTESMRIDSSGNVGIGASSPVYQTQIYGSGQTTAALTDAGNKGGSLLLNTPTVSGGDGGALLIGAGGSGAKPFAAVKGLLADGGGNTTGSLAFSTRNATGDTALTERMRITSGGNVGIGVTPAASTVTTLQLGTSTFSEGGGATSLASNMVRDTTWKSINTGTSGLYQIGGDSHYWYTAASASAGATVALTERMRIDSNGNVLIATTSTSLPQAGLILNSPTGLGAAYGRIDFCKTFSGNVTGCSFYHSTSQVGSITYSNTATAYNTSSDYRLKENIAPMTGALEKVAQLKPVTYNWKSDGSDGQGFIAHELAEIVPDCVYGEKDAMRTEQYEISPAIPATYDEEGNELTPAVEAVMGEREVPDYQGIDTSFLVATLTAAIQELKATVDAQAARIAALEGAK